MQVFFFLLNQKRKNYLIYPYYYKLSLSHKDSKQGSNFWHNGKFMGIPFLLIKASPHIFF